MSWDQSLPFGVRDTKVTAYTDTGATTLAGSSIDHPNAQSMSFSEAEDFEELRGDDKLIAVHGKGSSVEWEMDNGGISVPSYKAMAGGTTATSGTTPAQITTYTKKTTDVRPYFKAEGQSIADNGGDFHTVLSRCRVTGSFDGELADGAFWITNANGRALPSLVTGETDVIYKFILNETAVAIA